MLYYIILCYVMLYYIILYYITLYYITLHYIILYYIILYYIILYYIYTHASTFFVNFFKLQICNTRAAIETDGNSSQDNTSCPKKTV